MQVSYFLVLMLIAVASSTVSGVCVHNEIIKCFDNVMNAKINSQIAVQLKGQYTFLWLAQLYDRDTDFYGNIADFFRKKSTEHMTHAQTFMEYQNQRGGTVEMGGTQYPVELYTDNACNDVKSAKDAFECAMQLQAIITTELAELRDDAMRITIDNVVTECATVGAITDADSLLLSQSLLVHCALPGVPGIIKTGNWKMCNCESIKSVEYGELAQMIVLDFLNNQSEDRKEMSNHYQTLKKTDSCDCTRGVAEFLLDASMKPPPAPEEE